MFKLKQLLYDILLLLLFLFLAVTSFAQDAEIIPVAIGKNTRKVWSWDIIDRSNIPITFIADDGTKILVKMQDSEESRKYLALIKGNYRESDLWLSGIYLDDESRLINTFVIPTFYFYEDDHDYTLSFKKIKDFNNVSYYEFKLTLNDEEDLNKKGSYQYFDFKFHKNMTKYSLVRFNPNPTAKYEEEQLKNYSPFFEQTVFFWVDKDSKYSGSLDYPAIRFSDRDESKKQFEELSDLFLYLVNQELDKFEGLLDQQVRTYYNVPDNIRDLIKYISLHDKEVGNELQKRLDNLNIRREEWYHTALAITNTQTRLSAFTCIVSQSPLTVSSWDSAAPEKPSIAGELPTTDEELAVYLDWMATGYNGCVDENGNLCDIFGTPINFELVEYGLKAISAGPDKEFGTKDDIWIMRHESNNYNEYPLRDITYIKAEDLPVMNKLYGIE